MTQQPFSTLKKEIKQIASPEKAAIYQRFFKTGKGEYGEGDLFLGIKVPELRKLSKQYQELSYDDVKRLVCSKYHEERLLGLLILVLKYRQGENGEKKKIYNFYVQYLSYVNNWDLVDVTVEHVVGAYLYDKSKTPLTKWAKSKDLWERRIAIISTFHYIKQNEFNETLRIAKILLYDEHDLIHKAVGWMLREVGKRDLKVEEDFLKKVYKTMPRTMLRYAIEKFPESKRKAYLKGKI